MPPSQTAPWCTTGVARACVKWLCGSVARRFCAKYAYHVTELGNVSGVLEASS